jgi:hypothetical protein
MLLKRTHSASSASSARSALMSRHGGRNHTIFSSPLPPWAPPRTIATDRRSQLGSTRTSTNSRFTPLYQTYTAGRFGKNGSLSKESAKD